MSDETDSTVPSEAVADWLSDYRYYANTPDESVLDALETRLEAKLHAMSEADRKLARELAGGVKLQEPDDAVTSGQPG